MIDKENYHGPKSKAITGEGVAFEASCFIRNPRFLFSIRTFLIL